MSSFLRLLCLIGLALGMACTVFAEDCIECHKEETPAAVTQWQGSVHAATVGCSACHGEDHEAIINGKAFVDAKVCGRCHEKAFHEHVDSKHGMGLHTGWGCTRNLENRDPALPEVCVGGSIFPRCSPYGCQICQYPTIGLLDTMAS